MRQGAGIRVQSYKRYNGLYGTKLPITSGLERPGSARLRKARPENKKRAGREPIVYLPQV